VVAKENGGTPKPELFMPFPEAIHSMTSAELFADGWVNGMAMLPVATRSKIIAAWRAVKANKWIREQIIEPAFEQIDWHLAHVAEMEARAAKAAARAAAA
jgi:hypothetical protein